MLKFRSKRSYEPYENIVKDKKSNNQENGTFIVTKNLEYLNNTWYAEYSSVLNVIPQSFFAFNLSPQNWSIYSDLLRLGRIVA